MPSYSLQTSPLYLFFQGPKESSLWDKMQSRIPIINPLELDSPFIQGMGHDMLEEVEKLAITDTNQGANPAFPIRPGFDSNLIFGVVGKALPNNLLQWTQAQKGRIPYALKIGQDIGNRIQATVLSEIPTVALKEKIDKEIKISDKIEFQLEDSNRSKPLEVSSGNGFVSNLKSFLYNLILLIGRILLYFPKKRPLIK